jgi:hypothetical protein
VCIQARAVNSDVFILISLWGAERQVEARARQEHCHDNTNTNTNNGTFDTCSVLLLSLCRWLYQHAAHSHTHTQTERARASKRPTYSSQLRDKNCIREAARPFCIIQPLQSRGHVVVVKCVNSYLPHNPTYLIIFRFHCFTLCFYYGSVLTRKILTNLALNK